MNGEASPTQQQLDTSPTEVDAAQRQWLRTRAYLNQHRHSLAKTAKNLYPSLSRVSGTPLLTRPEWLPTTPLPLDRVQLSWRADPPDRGIRGTEPESAAVRPLRANGTRFASYADALGTLSRPRLFENRSCYRIIGLDQITDVGTSSTTAKLEFCDGSYFDIINVCEATAHEYAAALAAQGHSGLPDPANLPLRSFIDDPTDLCRRPVIPAISTLTLRADHGSGDVHMILHWRDPAKVASGGGLYQVAPVGVFQPSNDAPWNRSNDFNPWRAIVREMAEELLGSDEDYHSDVQPIDYERWPFYRRLMEARHAGKLGVYWLGLGIDPLTLVADMLTVTIIDSAVFDRTFAGVVTANEEGQILTRPRSDGASIGVPFNSETIERFVTSEPVQPAGAALLRLAWDQRTRLLTAAR